MTDERRKFKAARFKNWECRTRGSLCTYLKLYEVPGTGFDGAVVSDMWEWLSELLGEMFASSADGDVRSLAWLPAFQWLVTEYACQLQQGN
jgi:hypothetical protein